jgi:hypothetical protein
MGSRPTYLPQSYLDLNNRNHLGGRASNQNAAYQVVLTEAGPCKLKKDAEEPVGKKISAKCHKSSFGANQRQVGWDLITQPWLDSSDYLQPAIDFSRGTLDLLVRNKLLDLVVDGGAVTSKTLGITAVTSQEFLRAFYAHPDVVRDLGKRLRIEGMYGIEDLVAGNTSFNAPEIESGEEPEPDVPA